MTTTAAPGQGMICSPHPLATEAGLKVLRAGGNAAEAAVATGAALNVLCPHFCGLGGDAVWMVGDAEGLRSCILGIGHAGEATKPSGPALPMRGSGAALTTAGLVPSWETLLDLSARSWGGSQPLASLLSEAIGFAEDGYEVTASHRFWLDYRKDDIPGWPGFAEHFLPWGRLPQTGDRFTQDGLARVLRTLAKQGLESFGTGDVAAELAEGLAASGSPLTLQDLALTRADVVEPLSLTLGDWTLYAPPPPTQGAATLAIMGILDRLRAVPAGADMASALHLQVEAVKQAFLIRAGIADPDGATPDLLSDETLQRAANTVSREKAMHWPHEYAEADTVYLAVADNEGRYVSGLQSTYFDWGSGVPVGETGIIWHNRGAAFDTVEGSPNCLKPGRRPFHTLNPGMAFAEDGEALLYGTQGADGQPQTLSVLLDRLIGHGETPDDALKAPRFLLGRTFSDQEDTLKVEANAGAATLAQLRNQGHRVTELPELSPLAGQAGAIRVSPDGRKTGAHDPRGEGNAGAT